MYYYTPDQTTNYLDCPEERALEDYSICYEPMKPDMPLALHISCRNIWHRDCFQKGLGERGVGLCPLCRRPVDKLRSSWTTTIGP